MSTAGVGTAGPVSKSKWLALTAMLFAVAMTFIDQTIVAIASPEIQSELSLSRGGSQWVVNAYLLALAAAFAFGGRLTDVLGHKRMVLIGRCCASYGVRRIRVSCAAILALSQSGVLVFLAGSTMYQDSPAGVS